MDAGGSTYEAFAQPSDGIAPDAEASPSAGGRGAQDASAAQETPAEEWDEGFVQRRAPKNPLASPVLGKYRQGGGKKKVKDPRLYNNPVQGRMLVLIGTTLALCFVFLQELVYNYLSFNGRCVSTVVHFDETYKVLTAPYKIEDSISYLACELETANTADSRAAVGSGTADYGYNPSIRGGPLTKAAGGLWDSPNPRIYRQLGGLDTNLIRNYGETFRLFWSMWMHGGFMHILVNLACQIQILWMVEPDYGFWRTIFIYWVSGVTGNLLSGVLDPCSVTVGSSGCLYGLLACLIPYCIEFWKTIPRPCCILIFMVIVLVIGILSGFSGYTDNYAHMGGALGGLLSAFATTSTLTAFDDTTLAERMAVQPPFSWCIPPKTREALIEKAAGSGLISIVRTFRAVQISRSNGL